MTETCAYCDRPAAFRVEGWAGDGQDYGAVYQMVCAVHVVDFEGDDAPHGFDSVSAIIPFTPA